MSFSLPPVVKLAETLLVDIERAVGRFTRTYRYGFGADLRAQAYAVTIAAHTAWRDRKDQAARVEHLGTRPSSNGVRMGTANQTSFKPTHGMTRVGGWKGPIAPTYLTWQRMKARCLNKKAPDYAQYGGRGITVCKRWRDSFENFLSDMGERTREQQIDRIDNNGDYEPGNCRWVTKKQNSRNRRTSVLVTVDGVTRSASEWDEVMGLRRDTVADRLKRGWSPESAVKTPRQQRKEPHHG